MTNQFGADERVCLNCRHHRYSRNPFVWILHMLGDETLQHICTAFDRTNVNPITGKLTLEKNEMSCSFLRRNQGCIGGQLWEPKPSVARSKYNLFKIINHISK